MPTERDAIVTNLLDAAGVFLGVVASIWRQSREDEAGARASSAALCQSLHAHVGERAGSTARARAAIDAERAELFAPQPVPLAPFPLVAPREPEKP